MRPARHPAPFQRFLDEHRTAVLALLRVLVGSADADDCFQETFIAAMRSYERMDGANPRAWILTIARNKALDHHRARARRPVPSERLPEVAAPPEPERDEELWAAVAALPDRQRTAVALRFAGGLPYREVGLAMGGTENAARRNVHAGLRNLRAELGEERP